MSRFTVARMRSDASLIFEAAVKAVDAQGCVRRFVRLEGDTLYVAERPYDLGAFNRVLAVGAGKASARMAVALESILRGRLTGVVDDQFSAGPYPGENRGSCGFGNRSQRFQGDCHDVQSGIVPPGTGEHRGGDDFMVGRFIS